ncbi:MAG TPA: ABC transporter substrate-binding protein [Ilumatobacteraceae bacterium]|nr:ABC transporter substrate-binding protein [Ilumatobacteraceae bacterium]
MSRRPVVLLLALGVVVAAACGQKSGVAGSDAGGGATLPPVAPTTAAPPPATPAPGPVTSAPAPSGSDAPETTGGATVAPTTAPPTTAAPEAGPYEPGPNDKAGVSDTEIVIGIHAPVTGASPIPQESFDVGKDIYWQYLASTAPDALFGRNVRVVFRDDEFNPQHAVQVCREMVEQDGAFLLVGGGGADQITACAQYANEAGIPYLSAGVNETGLTDLSTYFATSLTYAEQAPMLVAQLQAQGFTEAALVVADTPSFDDAMAAIKEAAAAAGLGIPFETRINKDASPAESATVAQQLKDSGVEAVMLLSSPVVYVLGLAAGAAGQSYNPVWLGPGITSGLNAVTAIGCPNVSTGEFFSPTPGLDVIDQLDPDFTTAYAEFANGAPADDIGLQLWALNKAIALMLEATGPELGRAAFMNTLVTASPFDNGIYSPLEYSVDDHLGGTGAALLQADCDIKQFVTAEQFVQAP